MVPKDVFDFFADKELEKRKSRPFKTNEGAVGSSEAERVKNFVSLVDFWKVLLTCGRLQAERLAGVHSMRTGNLPLG
jgi:hypothetical protein